MSTINEKPTNKIAIARKIVSYWSRFVRCNSEANSRTRIYINNGTTLYKIGRTNDDLEIIELTIGDEQPLTISVNTPDNHHCQAVIDAYSAMQGLTRDWKMDTGMTWLSKTTYLYLFGDFSGHDIGYNIQKWNPHVGVYMTNRLFWNHDQLMAAINDNSLPLPIESMTVHEMDHHNEIITKLHKFLFSPAWGKLARCTVSQIPDYCNVEVMFDFDFNTGGKIFRAKLPQNCCYMIGDGYHAFVHQLGTYVHPMNGQNLPTHEQLTDYHIIGLRNAKVLFEFMVEISL